jgi:signal transduction histidine kinase
LNYVSSEKQQVFNVNIDPAIPNSLVGDGKRLKQVLTTFLANAVKFTPEQGEISLSVRILDECSEIITLQFEVTDNGIGIAKKYQEKLFDIFEQADGGLTRKRGGIGIGLALSKRIIELMGGKIWVDTEPGKGSTFTFTCQMKKT